MLHSSLAASLRLDDTPIIEISTTRTAPRWACVTAALAHKDVNSADTQKTAMRAGHSAVVLWMFVRSMEHREPGLVDLIKSLMPRAYVSTKTCLCHARIDTLVRVLISPLLFVYIDLCACEEFILLLPRTLARAHTHTEHNTHTRARTCTHAQTHTHTTTRSKLTRTHTRVHTTPGTSTTHAHRHDRHRRCLC